MCLGGWVFGGRFRLNWKLDQFINFARQINWSYDGLKPSLLFPIVFAKYPLTVGSLGCKVWLTLVSEDTYWRLYWNDSSRWWRWQWPWWPDVFSISKYVHPDTHFKGDKPVLRNHWSNCLTCSWIVLLPLTQTLYLTLELTVTIE